MTDTVNVPREAWGEYKRSQIAHLRPYLPGETLSERVSISMADLEAGSPKDGDMIARNPANHDDQWLVASDYFAANFEPVASAPKAEPVRDPYKLEAVKHLITTRLTLHDTDVTLGGVDRVAADIIAMLMPQPEAPKVEQEPVAWIARNYDIQKMGVTQCKNEVERYEQNGWEIEPLYTHPAPSSELLEALKELIDSAEEVRVMLAAHPAMQGRENVSLGVAFTNAIGRAQRAYVAKHKGPQS